MKKLLAFLFVFTFTLPAGAQTVPSSQAEVKLSFSPIVKKVAPAVVNIYAKRLVQTRQSISPFFGDPFFNQFFGGRGFGMPRERVESSLGSGVIIESDGLVITNAHVVKNALEAVIVLNDGREFDAEIALIDEASDIALLKVDEKNLPFATLKPSETLEVGDLVLAIGNPFGVGQTVTSGIVSALARSSFNINDINFFIQTDAAINPGNSGGPLVDMSGHVVGINTAIYSKDGGSLGIGFSVPSEMVQTIITAEKTGAKNNKGNIKRPWLGVTTQKVTSDIALSLGLDRPTGSLISALHPQSPLAKEGLKIGDIVTHINGKDIRDAAEMQFRLLTVAIGERVKVTYQRGEKAKSVDVKMIAAPDLPDRKETKITGDNILQGARMCFINPALKEELAVDLPNEGIVVCGMEDRAYAKRLLRVGDVILGINDKEVTKPWDVQQIADRLDNRRGIRITLIRNGQKQVLAVR